jgi:hypothetical protein
MQEELEHLAIIVNLHSLMGMRATVLINSYLIAYFNAHIRVNAMIFHFSIVNLSSFEVKNEIFCMKRNFFKFMNSSMTLRVHQRVNISRQWNHPTLSSETLSRMWIIFLYKFFLFSHFISVDCVEWKFLAFLHLLQILN